MSNYPRGSEWRRWDLHVHTASSYDYGYKGTDSDKLLAEALMYNNIAAVAITDHFVIDKDKINNLKNIAPNIIFFPGVELRTDKGDTNIHIVLIFSDKIDLNILTENFNVFKRDAINSSDNEKIYWDYKEIVKFAKKHNALISIHAGSKTSGIDDKISNTLPHNQAVKTEYATTINIFEMGKIQDLDCYRKNVFPTIGIKPMVICSDNHDARNYNPSHKLWIKADPTFEGLKQAIIEPDRIFIGEMPPTLDRIKNNKTKIIERLNIQYDKGYNGSQGYWFNNVDVEFNPEMTAIIGNKGNGKTALAEITALLCNCKNDEKDLNFLHNTKFRRKGLASNFKATITWQDSVLKNSKNLGETSDANSDELAHFVPQKSFEKYCNESDEEFISEIDNVVFSRMDKADRLGFKNFKELIENQKEVINSKKDELYIDIKNINLEIKRLEEKKDINHKKSLESTLKQITLEKDEHFKIKPQEILPPSDLNTPEYKKLANKKKIIDNLIYEYDKKLTDIKKEMSELSLIESEITNLKSTIDNKFIEIKKRLIPFNMDFDLIFSYSLNNEAIIDKISCFNNRVKKIVSKINISQIEENNGSLIKKKKIIENDINKYNESNSGKLTIYQNYLKNKEDWDKKLSEITEREEKLKIDIEYIGDLQSSKLISDIDAKRSDRLQLTERVFTCFTEEVIIYAKLKEKIVSFIDQYKNEMKNYNVSIESGIYIQNNFVKTFVEKYIDCNKNSPFKSTEGTTKIKEITDKSDVNNWDGVVSLLNTIQKEFDDYDSGNKSYHNMFRKDKYDEYVNDLYNLKFLDARYSLRLYDKPLNELSPGERGSLLLVFYLLLDARDNPLILDQPEDNLDNESVANILVPFIREAKKRRQIIIITHNSNLAVVSDAEQIIRVKIDKQNNNKFSLESGSLESNIINDVINVLEGTKRSFNIRDNKYKILGE